VKFTLQTYQEGRQTYLELVKLNDDIRRAREKGAGDAQLSEALKLQRRAQFRTDFVNAENSNGFHAPQEAARILGEAIDYARRGQLALRK
jgi:nitrite reductase (cytochrome c-552)